MDIIFLQQAHRFIKKSNRELKERLKVEVLKIKNEPHIGKKLKGLNMLSHKFIFKKVHYRIAYKVVDNIVVIMIATRENFYRDLERNS